MGEQPLEELFAALRVAASEEEEEDTASTLSSDSQGAFAVVGASSAGADGEWELVSRPGNGGSSETAPLDSDEEDELEFDAEGCEVDEGELEEEDEEELEEPRVLFIPEGSNFVQIRHLVQQRGIQCAEDLWSLRRSERLTLLAAAGRCEQRLDGLCALEAERQEIMGQLERLRMRRQLQALSGVEVIGMTTTGASFLSWACEEDMEEGKGKKKEKKSVEKGKICKEKSARNKREVCEERRGGKGRKERRECNARLECEEKRRRV